MRPTTAFITALFVSLLGVWTLRARAEAPNLIAFVGEKISVEEFKGDCCENCICMDLAFRARYRVLEVVFGSLPESEITFDAFDHYGTPAFSMHDHVLLYVSRRDDGTFYHQKYQYQAVYQTTAGTWAGCGPPYQFEHEVHWGPVTSQPLKFAKPVWFSLKELEREEAEERYPLDHFRHSRGRAYCTHGTPVEGLFQVKRDGVLKAREVFD